jgi:hypothetical protein
MGSSARLRRPLAGRLRGGKPPGLPTQAGMIQLTHLKLSSSAGIIGTCRKTRKKSTRMS